MRSTSESLVRRQECGAKVKSRTTGHLMSRAIERWSTVMQRFHTRRRDVMASPSSFRQQKEI